ncbi:MAG: ABC transporter permease [Dokdonella sp.]
MNTLLLEGPRVSLPRCYRLEAKHEFLRLLRTPSFALPTLLFPPLFYVLFALMLNRGNGAAASYLFASYSIFGVMAPGLFGFGVSVALDRERGWLTLRRALPMPAGAYLVAKMVMAMSFATIIYLLLASLALGFGGVRLAASAWWLLGLVAVLGVLPFCALGLLIGSRVSAAAAPAIVNVVYLPMAFLSGLWMPLSMLPDFVHRLAPLWPSFHLAQLALAASGRDYEGAIAFHLGFLFVFTTICFAVARHALARSV